VRPSFYYWSIVMTGGIVVMILKNKSSISQKLTMWICIGCMFFLPFVYTVTSNMVLYHEFALQSVDTIFWREVYISNFIGRGIPFAGNPAWEWPPQAYEAWYEFSSPTTPEGRRLMANKYRDKTMTILKADPSKFITQHLPKLWYVWEKHFLYPYQIGPDSPIIRFIVYWGNIFLLCMGFMGASIYSIKQKHHADNERFFLGMTSLGLFAYISVAHIFSTSEERFSLPAYPMLAVFAGYMITIIGQTYVSSSRKKINEKTTHRII
jgi:hypothetical protein